MSNIEYIMDRIVRTEMDANFGLGRRVRLEVADMRCDILLADALQNSGGFGSMSRNAMMEMEVSRKRHELAQDVLVRAYGERWEDHL